MKRISYGLKNEFELAMVKEASVFESLRFNCIWFMNRVWCFVLYLQSISILLVPVMWLCLSGSAKICLHVHPLVHYLICTGAKCFFCFHIAFRALHYVNSLENYSSHNVRKCTFGDVRPVKIQIRLFTGRILDNQGCKVSSCGQRRFWSDCADAQADWSLRWAHITESTFFFTLGLICTFSSESNLSFATQKINGNIFYSCSRSHQNLATAENAKSTCDKYRLFCLRLLSPRRPKFSIRVSSHVHFKLRYVSMYSVSRIIRLSTGNKNFIHNLNEM